MHPQDSAPNFVVQQNYDNKKTILFYSKSPDFDSNASLYSFNESIKTDFLLK